VPAPIARRTDLDWLRIGAFALLIFYHIGMFYVTWDWHVKSSRAGPSLEPLMLATNPWRLLLLFIISGAATRFMADKMSVGAFLGARSWRLLPPLLFAIFVIVPPQTYYEVVARGWSGSFGEFYAGYATASGGWTYADGERLITPTYNHVWFVAYLFVYTLVLAGLRPLLKRLPRLSGLIAGPALILVPWLYLFAVRALLFPAFGETHALVDDWAAHAVYFAGFVFGYAIAKQDGFFAQCVRMRHWAIGLAIASYGVLMWARATYDQGGAEPPAWGPLAAVGLREMQAWAMIVALIGYAHRHLRQGGPRAESARRYLTDAIFPIYLVHQTIIVVVGWRLDALALPLWQEAGLLIAATVAGCFLAYEIARRISWLRPLFGLKLSPDRTKKFEPRGDEGHIKGEA
jgi:hypothetical protein